MCCQPPSWKDNHRVLLLPYQFHGVVFFATSYETDEEEQMYIVFKIEIKHTVIAGT